jgi:hypothetical protein
MVVEVQFRWRFGGHLWLHGQQPAAVRSMNGSTGCDPFAAPGLRVALRSGDPTASRSGVISQVELVLGRESGEHLGEVVGDRLPQDVEVDVELVVDGAVGRKRVERVMRQAGLQDSHLRRRWRTGSTPQDLAATPAPDLVNRDFTAAGPDRFRVADATRIPCGQGHALVGRGP